RDRSDASDHHARSSRARNRAPLAPARHRFDRRLYGFLDGLGHGVAQGYASPGLGTRRPERSSRREKELRLDPAGRTEDDGRDQPGGAGVLLHRGGAEADQHARGRRDAVTLSAPDAGPLQNDPEGGGDPEQDENDAERAHGRIMV